MSFLIENMLLIIFCLGPFMHSANATISRGTWRSRNNYRTKLTLFIQYRKRLIAEWILYVAFLCLYYAFA